MSRIREALKKAAQERARQSDQPPTSQGLELSADELTNLALPNETAVSEEKDVRLGGSRFEAQVFQDFVKKCLHPKWQIDPQFSVFNHQDHAAAGAERFRTLRSRLFQIAATRLLSRLVVTSSVPAEGKTFVTANLGQSFARQPGCRVLLIDADLRASRLHLPFGAQPLPGLAEYLKGEADEAQITQVGGEGNLCLIPAGCRVLNPNELIHGARMKRLLDKMSNMFDWILLDSPPALAVHDASLLADICDGVLFVVQAGSTDFEVAQKASSEFRDKNLVGIVLNRVEKSDGYGEYYYADYGEKQVTSET